MPNFAVPTIVTLLIAGCTPESSVSDSPSEATTVDALPPPTLMSLPDAPVVPAYALIASGPREAVLLWVPWAETDAAYTVEVQRAAQDEWVSADAAIATDHAMVRGLAAGDVVRVTARGANGVLHSKGLPFAPASSAPATLNGHRLVDGRALGWSVSEATVVGDGPAPAVGDVLVLPLTPETLAAPIRTVTDVSTDANGWLATVDPFDQPFPSGARISATMNLSLDGVPRSALTSGSQGRSGYCSTSGWGCLEFSDEDIASHFSVDVDVDDGDTNRSAYVGDWPVTMSTDLLAAGMEINAVATGGVLIEASYELGWTSLVSASVLATPYASGTITANVSTSSGSIPEFEQTLLSSGSIPIYSAALASITADFDLAAIATLETSGPVEGAWTGYASFARPAEVGYQSHNRGLYGPVLHDPAFDIGLTPEFADGSEAEIGFGWRVTGSVALNGGFWEIARGDLIATAGLVFAHDSTVGLPCGETTSIARADVALRARLDATVDFIGLDPWEYPLADRRKVLLSWGRPRQVVAGRTFVDSPLRFRLLSDDTPAARDASVDPTDVVTFLDGVANPAPVTIEGGKFVVDLPAQTVPGEHTFSVWLPDAPPAVPSPATLLNGHGQCLSRTIVVEAAQ